MGQDNGSGEAKEWVVWEVAVADGDFKMCAELGEALRGQMFSVVAGVGATGLSRSPDVGNQHRVATLMRVSRKRKINGRSIWFSAPRLVD